MFRFISNKLKENLKISYDGKTPIQVLYGPRRVGKSTLLKNAFPNAKYINIEEGEYIDILNSRDPLKLKAIAENKSNILILDEFQRLEDPGLIAKVFFDSVSDIKLILSGSSSIEIANKASESIGGRANFLKLYPLTVFEKQIQNNKLSENFSLEDLTSENNLEYLEILRYGLYPKPFEIDVEQYLYNLIDTFLLKDLIYLDIIRNTKVIKELLTLLAYQIGQKVNYTEIASRLQIDRATVRNYISLLESLFIIFTLRPYRNKRRDEIGLEEKVYFYDIGIRNALINNFTPLNLRQDAGNLFENFIIAEVLKLNDYFDKRYELRYWRTKSGSEVDLVLTSALQPVEVYEIKLKDQKIKQTFVQTYPETEKVKILTSTNYLQELYKMFIK